MIDCVSNDRFAVPANLPRQCLQRWHNSAMPHAGHCRGPSVDDGTSCVGFGIVAAVYAALSLDPAGIIGCHDCLAPCGDAGAAFVDRQSPAKVRMNIDRTPRGSNGVSVYFDGGKDWVGTRSEAAAVTGRGSAASRAAAPAATAAARARNPRREEADVFAGGVLCTLSAWVMGLSTLMVRVRAGAEVRASPRLAF